MQIGLDTAEFPTENVQVTNCAKKVDTYHRL